MYEVKTSNAFKKFLKKMDKPLQQNIVDLLNTLENDPDLGEPLLYDLSRYNSIHLDYGKIGFRIAYEKVECCSNIAVLYGGPRNDFYKEFKKYLRRIARAE